MTGKKRTRSGDVKPQNAQQAARKADQDIPMTEPTPLRTQPQPPLNHNSQKDTKPTNRNSASNQEGKNAKHSHSKPITREKLPKLPPNVSITKRPLLHPPLPTPFSSSNSPKVLYITASTPHIPSIKRIRKLLSEISKRDEQSLASTSSSSKRKKPLEANGRLKNGDVEREIADGVGKSASAIGSGKQGDKEKVYLKATGRAIPRVLELGVHFQGEDDCVVRVEMGSVKAVDDIEVQSRGGEEGVGLDAQKKKEEEEEEDVPETRIRTVSSVTVSIGLR